MLHTNRKFKIHEILELRSLFADALCCLSIYVTNYLSLVYFLPYFPFHTSYRPTMPSPPSILKYSLNEKKLHTRVFYHYDTYGNVQLTTFPHVRIHAYLSTF